MVARCSVKQVIKELRSLARKHGYEVRYYTYSALKDKSYHRGFTPQFPAGEFDRRKKRILIRKYRNTLKHSVMCVLAHEISHMLHLIQGKYPKYYSDYWVNKILEHHRNNNSDLSDLDITCYKQGVKAERDCDRWAQEFLAARGHQYNSKMKRLYPESMVMGYPLYVSYLIGLEIERLRPIR